MSEYRRRRASETHTNYPRWKDPTTGEWRASTCHSLREAVCRPFLRRLERSAALFGGFDIPLAWDSHQQPRQWHVYYLLRFLLDFMPPRPDRDHVLNFREDGENRIRLFWCGGERQGEHDNEFKVADCCDGLAPPAPVIWNDPSPYLLPDELEPRLHIWAPGAFPGHPSYLPPRERSQIEPPSARLEPDQRLSMGQLALLLGEDENQPVPEFLRVAEGVTYMPEDERRPEDAVQKMASLPESCLCPDGFPSPHCWLDHDSSETVEPEARVRMS